MEGWDGFGARAAPLAGIFGAAVLARRALYDHAWLPAHDAGVPVLSVGALEVGGSGKTPVTGWLLAALLRLGRRPGLLTRGYGRPTRALAVRLRGAPACAMAIGDEPAMLVREGLDVPVAAVAQRRLGALALRGHCDTLVLDDAFSHRALRRALDIVVLNAERPLGNGHLLPWGTLREPASSLARAHVLWLHHRAASPSTPAWPGGHRSDAVRVQSRATPSPPIDAAGAPVDLRGTPVLAAAGIAAPARFFACVAACGATVVDAVRFRDHHRFTRADVDALRQRQRRIGAAAVVVTPKDMVKLAGLWPVGSPLWQLGTQVQLVAGHDALLARIKALLFS